MGVLKNALKQVYPSPAASILKALFSGGEAGALYEPWNMDTLFEDDAGTIQASIDGVVGRMEDQSGNGNHVTQSTTSAKPILRETSQGLVYLEFDGSDDVLRSGANADLSTSDDVIWAAAFSKSGSGVPVDHEDVNGNGRFRVFSNGVGGRSSGGDTFMLVNSSDMSTESVLLGRIDRVNAELTGRENASSLGSDTGSTGTWFPDLVGAAVGAEFSQDANFEPMKYYGGLFISRALTTSERDTVESTLADKSGATL